MRRSLTTWFREPHQPQRPGAAGPESAAQCSRSKHHEGRLQLRVPGTDTDAEAAAVAGVDYRPTSHDVITVTPRRMWVTLHGYNQLRAFNGPPILEAEHHYTSASAAVKWNHIFSPRLVNELISGFSGDKQNGLSDRAGLLRPGGPLQGGIQSGTTLSAGEPVQHDSAGALRRRAGVPRPHCGRPAAGRSVPMSGSSHGQFQRRPEPPHVEVRLQLRTKLGH